MIEITMNEAKEKLMNASSALYEQSFYTIQLNDKHSKSCAYESHNSVIIKAFRGVDPGEFTWKICYVGNSDVLSALAEVKEESGDNIRIDVYRIGEYDGELIFTGTGKTYSDPDIRPIFENDIEQIRSLVTIPDDDTDYAKSIGKSIENQIATIGYPWVHTLGIFDGLTLAGVIISVMSFPQILVEQKKIPKNFVHINSIFIHRDYRGRGYAPRSIRAATAVCPDARYSYICHKENLPSKVSIKSAGYSLAGTWRIYNL